VGILSQHIEQMNRVVFSKLVKLHIITPGGIFNLVKCFFKDGISLMALLRFATVYYPDCHALVADGKRLTYSEMYSHACDMTKVLLSRYKLNAEMCVAIMCRNHITVALLLPALSRLGVKVKLINTDFASLKIYELVQNNNINLLICDSDLKETRVPDNLSCMVTTTEELNDSILGNEKDIDLDVPRIRRGGDISVFTGGSSGKHKEAPRKMNIFQFLPPFFALLDRIHIDKYKSVFLPLPIYHGFGLVTFIVSILMGKKICLVSRFNAEGALKIIDEVKIDVIPLVPAMLARLWQDDKAPALMKSVKCIISGGDRLDKKWIDATSNNLGNVLFNLYGTSEAGFFMLASPDDLMRNEEVTIGRPIKGVKCKVEDIDSNGTGSLWVKSNWAMISMKDKWQNTGDRVYCNSQGYYFYRGRSDNMVVCGGENVYPENVEKIINEHPDVLTSIVFPAPDPQFGTVLNAKVELKPGSSSSVDEIAEWLRPRLSRAEMPHNISIQSINILDTGKISRN